MVQNNLESAPISNIRWKITKRIWNNIPAKEKFVDTSGPTSKMMALLKGASGQGNKWIEVYWNS